MSYIEVSNGLGFVHQATQISPADVAIRPGIFLCDVFTVRSQYPSPSKINCTPCVRLLLTPSVRRVYNRQIEAALSQRGDGQMKTFAASHTQARHAIEDAAFTAVRNKMILPSEQTGIVKAAMLSLQMTGTAYICGETIILTSRAQDGIRAAAIRNMSDAQFDRFAYGL